MRKLSKVILEECEAKISVKKYNNYNIVSLVKTSIHDNKEGGLLERHNKNMTKSLGDTQTTYLELLMLRRMHLATQMHKHLAS